jgi:hypothetical protein
VTVREWFVLCGEITIPAAEIRIELQQVRAEDLPD